MPHLLRRSRLCFAAAVVLTVFFFSFLTSSSNSGSIKEHFRSGRSRRSTDGPLDDVDGDTAAQQKPLGAGNVLSGDNYKDFFKGAEKMTFEFTDDLSYTLPTVDLTSFASYPPHNLDPATPQHTFATYLCTRNSSIEDPYFVATQEVAYRLLWRNNTASQYPFTVFVAPFISQRHRDILRGAGANVVELPLVEFHGNVDMAPRWRDLFSKLHMWKQTQFDLITFLDSDAFPIANIDDVFDKAERRKCIESRLKGSDLANKADICDYTFAGSPLPEGQDINVGVVVLKPNLAMHHRLLRLMTHTDKWDNNMAEQGFLNFAFAQDSPFPLSHLVREYDGYFPQEHEANYLKVVHEKLWAFGVSWTEGMFANTWKELLGFYESDEFARARKVDGGGKSAAPRSTSF